MNIIKWIKKNNFKDIDDELSDQIDKLNVLQSDKEKLTNKIKYYKTNLRSLKESLDIVNGKISRANKKALKGLKVLPIISIGFDARSSTYICIVKYKNATKSFYLGNESKIKSQLQQFYIDDLHTKKLDYVKDQVKMIVSNVISDFINTRSKSIFTESPKLNFTNVLEKYYESNLWEHWRSI
tara:strand:- start:5410 stop:5955 length:546 start_codon:yes stop_codon:yes gene_type:complete